MSLPDRILNPLKEDKIKELRENRLIEIKIWSLAKEIFFYFMFIWVLYVVSYSNLNINTFEYKENMRHMFVSSDFSQVKEYLQFIQIILIKKTVKES